MPLPNMSDALDGLGDPMMVAVIAKSTQDFEAKETITRFQEVYGVQVPTQPRDLILLPEGERQWRYITLYSADTTLRNDFYVEDSEKTQYRIMSVEPWQSFVKYLLQECPRAGSAGEPVESFPAEAS
jgi:hypothetical protein